MDDTNLLEEEDTSRTMGYCPKCGFIWPTLIPVSEHGPCPVCKLTYQLKIPREWHITEKKRDEFWDKSWYGEWSSTRAEKEWVKYCQPFTDMVIKNNPLFDESCYKEIPKFWKRRKYVIINCNKDALNRNGAECPECKSRNVRRLTWKEKITEIGIPKLIKRRYDVFFHCNNCLNNFVRRLYL